MFDDCTVWVVFGVFGVLARLGNGYGMDGGRLVKMSGIVSTLV